MLLVMLILFAYLLGSVPFGLLIARTQGVDLRRVGSGNIGATNAARMLGKKWGTLCFTLDVLKGLLPMLMVPLLGLADETTGLKELTGWLLVGCAAVLGHVFPVYLKFKGGKGVATSLGIVLGLWPYYTMCGIAAFVVWAACIYIWRYVSLASIIAAACFPVFLLIAILSLDDWHLEQLWPLLLIAALMCLLVVFRHRDNLKRLAAGSETKVFQKPAKSD
jgi:glycerol-3-phosphate acyltransferase PlsY